MPHFKHPVKLWLDVFEVAALTPANAPANIAEAPMTVKERTSL